MPAWQQHGHRSFKLKTRRAISPFVGIGSYVHGAVCRAVVRVTRASDARADSLVLHGCQLQGPQQCAHSHSTPLHVTAFRCNMQWRDVIFLQLSPFPARLLRVHSRRGTDVKKSNNFQRKIIDVCCFPGLFKVTALLMIDSVTHMKK